MPPLPPNRRTLRDAFALRHFAVPAALCLVLLAVRLYDAKLFAFLVATACAAAALMTLGSVADSSSRGDDGHLRYLGYALPWVALFELAHVFVLIDRPGVPQLAAGMLTAAHLVLAGIFAVSAHWVGRRTTVSTAVIPWGAAALLLFAVVLAGVFPNGVVGAGHAAAVEITLLAYGAAGFVRRRARMEPAIFVLLLAAAALLLAASLARLGTAGAALGHLGPLIALWLVYLAALRGAHTLDSMGPYRLMFESTLVGVALTRPDGSLITANPAFARIFGFDTPQELVREVANLATLYADPEERETLAQRLQREGAVRDFQVRMRRRDGTQRWIAANLAVVRGRGGEVLGYQGSAFDITEEKLAGERVQLERTRREKLLEILPVGVWLLDERGKVVDANEAGRRIWTGARYVGVEQSGRVRGWWLAEDAGAAVDEWPGARLVVPGETRLNDELEIQCVDGSRRVVRHSAMPIRDGERTIGALVVNEDITETRRHEAELQQMAAIVKSSDDAIFRAGVDGAVLTWNDGARGMYGYEADEMIGHPVARLIPQELRAAENRIFARVCAGGRVSHYETTRLRRDGSRVQVSLSVSPVLDAGGRVVGVSKIARDISEAKRVREALAESESRFRSLTVLSSDWFWETDEEHRFRETVSRATEITGLRAANYVGKRRWEVEGLAPVSGDWSDHREVLAQRASYRDLELVHARPDGSRGFLQISGEPVFDATGNFTGYRGTAKDITARKRDEQLMRLEHGVTRCLAESETEAAALTGVLRQICQAEGWAAGRYFGVDETGDVLCFREGWGIDQPAVADFLERSRSITYRRGEGLSGWAWEKGEPLWVAEASADPRASGRTIMAKGALRGGVMVLPVSSDGATLGVLSFSRAEASAPEERLLRALNVIASQVGQFLLRKCSEAVLRQSEERFRGLVELSSDWYWEQDDELRFTRFQGHVTDKSGNDPRAALGRRRWEIETITPVSCTWEEHRALLAQRQPFRDFEYSRIGDSGSVRYVSVSGEPVYDAGGLFKGYRGVAADITARRNAEAERLALSERDAAILRALGEVVYEWRPPLDQINWRGDYTRILGYTPAEMGADTASWTSRVHPEDKQAALDEVEAARREQRGYDLQYRFRHRDGHYIWMHDRGVLLLDNAGAIERVIGVFMDISMRKAAEERQRAQDVYFRSLIEGSYDIISVTDLEWRYTYMSPALRRILGRDPADAIGRKFLDYSSVDPEAARATAAAALQSPDATHTMQVQARDAAGELREMETRIARRADAQGAPIYVITSTDITERKRAERALAASESKFRALIEHGGDAITLYDRDLRMTYRSASAERITGYSDADRLGGHLGDVIHSDDRDSIRALLRELLAAPGRAAPFRCRCWHRNGTLRWLEGVATNLLDEPAVGALVVNYRDIHDRIQAEEGLRRSEAELRALAENAPDAILRIDAELRCIFANPAAVKSAGRPVEQLVGRSLLDPEVAEDLRGVWLAAIRRVMATGETQTADYSFRGVRGLRHYQARFAPERHAEGAVASVLVISRDVTERLEAQRALADSEEMMRGILQASAAPLLLVDLGGVVTYGNPAASELLGRPADALSGEPLGLPLAGGRPAEVEFIGADGSLRTAEMRVARATLPAGPSLVVSLHDLTERKRYEQHVQHLANHDGLTGLPNRALLRDRVEQAILHARRTQGYVGLMFVDLDRFKLVNDSWGHLLGDALLLEVGARLKKAVREGDTVARLGGDEFVLLLPDLARPADTATVARKVAHALGEAPVVLEGRELHATASIGIAVYPGDGEDLDTLLQCADAAMYRAKDAGRNGYHYYSAEMGSQARARVETETGLRLALERSELRLHYQPQVDLRDGRITGFEALLRWEHPARGLVSPGLFIPVAEDSGLIVPIGEWALREACREAAGWAAAGLGELKVSVNLSARQFWRGGVTEAVRAALAASGLPPRQLEVEITESVVARDLQQVMMALEQLRRMGVSIAIDDFGTGYSSLAYLRSLPIEKLKIDKSFIDGIPGDAEASALVSEIVRLAHVLSLEVVAEGVESHAQAAYLRDAGCEAMQGFVFSRPMPGADCAALLRSRRAYQFIPDAPKPT